MGTIAGVQQVPIGALTPYERNAKLHSPEQVKKIADSIREFGFISPCLIDREGNVIAGHGRLLAAQELGMTEVPCVCVEGLTEAQRRAYILADNRLTELGEWDDALVLEELKQLQEERFDTGITGFDLEAIDITDDMDAEIEPDEFEQIENTAQAKVHRGEIWQLGDHRLMCGDSTNRDDIIALMGGATADLLVTDPPYNVALGVGDTPEIAKKRHRRTDGLQIENDAMENCEFEDFLFAAFENAGEVMRPGAAYYCWYASTSQKSFQTALERSGMPPHQVLIWVKSSLVLGRQDYQWRHEPCFYGWKEGAGHYFIDARALTTVMDPTEDMTKEQLLQIVKDLTSITTTIYEDKPVRSEEHPTMKPLGLFKKLIRNSSRKCENVLDIFCGSGTTILAAEEMGRRAFGMELDPRFCDVIIERWEQATGGKAVQVNV